MGIWDKFFGAPSRDQFARAMIAQLRQAGDERPIHYDQTNFRLITGDQSETNLANIYHEHCQLPRKERPAHLQRLVRDLLLQPDPMPEDFESARSSLRPKIWSRAGIDNLRSKPGADRLLRPNLLAYPLGEHLYSSLVYDFPTSMRSISEEDLERWGVSYYEAMEAACENLHETTTAIAKIGNGFYGSMTGDHYDSSRVLLLDLIHSLDIQGDPVVIVPHRDALYVTGTEDREGLETLLRLTQEAYQQQPRPLSPLPMRLVDDQWLGWEPPADHPLAAGFAQLQLEFLGALYAEQKEMLQSLPEYQADDALFIASYSGMRKTSSEETLSYCVWAEGVASMLPHTQYIVLPTRDSLEGEGPKYGARWERVRQVVGDLLHPLPNFYPRRYRALEFPSHQQLQEIGLFQ